MTTRAVLALVLLLACPAPVRAEEPAPVEPAPDEPAPAEPAPPEPAPAGPVVVPPKPLEVPQAAYPPDALEQGLEADVVLVLDIAADGTVAAATVKEPVGFGFDEAAVEAVRRMRFSPATVDGVPTPVRVSYTYRFTIEKRVEPPPEPPAPEPVVVVRGRVVERGTKKPVVGVPIVLVETGETFLTDEEGRFEVLGPGPGAYTLEIPTEDYKAFTRAVTAPEGRPAEVTLRLTRNIYAGYRTVIRKPRIVKEVTKQSLEAPIIQKIPGNSGDAIKVVQLLPGVARGAFGTGQPIVRGSSPEDTEVFLEGIQLPQLFHFGGIYSTINTDLLSSVDFWPGGFSARYGQALGGIIDVGLRPLRMDRWHGTAEVNVFHTGVLLEGPVGEDTAIALAGRRSYVDAIIPLVVPDDALDLVVAPRYYDYQARLEHAFSDRSRLSMILYGSDDRLVFLLDEPSGNGGFVEGRIDTRAMFHQALGTWTLDATPDLRFTNTFGVGWNALAFDVGGGVTFDLDVVTLDLRSEVSWSLAKDVVLNAGVRGGVWPFNLSFFGPRLPKEGEVEDPPDPNEFSRTEARGTVRILAPYVEGVIRIANRLTLVPGLRLDTWFVEQSSYAAVDPRLGWRFQAADDTVLKGYVGLYHQPPEFDEIDRELGNPDVGPERAFQVSVGVEQALGPNVTVDLQGFYKWMDQLIVPVDPVERGVIYANEGVGRVYGMELLVKHAPTDRFFGWLSYTLLRAERRDQPGGPWRLFDFDQTHILNLVGVVRLGRGWETGLRFRYTTGNPRTPIIGSIYDSGVDGYVPISGEVNSERQTPFHQLDLRVDKKWVFDLWMLNLYLEVQNVYARENTEATAYNYDYTESAPIRGIPIIPNFGIRAEF